MHDTSTEIVGADELSKRERRHLRREERGNHSTGKNRSLIYLIGFLVLIFGLAGAILLAGKNNTGGEKKPIAAPTQADHVQGSLTAKAVLMEYSDFECPACSAYFPYVEDMKKEFGNDLTLVYRYFPLTQHPNAQIAAFAAEAAGKQGKFWEMYDMLFKNQSAWAGKADAKATFSTYAKDLGLNVTQFEADSADKVTRARVESDTTAGLAAGISATPTFYLNGKQITPQSPDELKTLVATAIKGTK